MRVRRHDQRRNMEEAKYLVHDIDQRSRSMRTMHVKNRYAVITTLLWHVKPLQRSACLLRAEAYRESDC